MKEKKNLFKKLLITMMPLLFVIPVMGTTQMYEHWLQDEGYAGVFGNNIWGQQITIGATGQNTRFMLKTITVKVCRDIESQPGIAYIELYKQDKDGFPNGNLLSSGSFNADTITTEYSGEEINVDMQPTALNKNGKYIFVLKVPDGDGYNKVKLRCVLDTEEEPHELYPGGMVVYSNNEGDSWNIVTASFYFKIIGNVK